jgi:hypothetical protein
MTGRSLVLLSPYIQNRHPNKLSVILPSPSKNGGTVPQFMPRWFARITLYSIKSLDHKQLHSSYSNVINLRISFLTTIMVHDVSLNDLFTHRNSCFYAIRKSITLLTKHRPFLARPNQTIPSHLNLTLTLHKRPNLPLYPPVYSSFFDSLTFLGILFSNTHNIQTFVTVRDQASNSHKTDSRVNLSWVFICDPGR